MHKTFVTWVSLSKRNFCLFLRSCLTWQKLYKTKFRRGFALSACCLGCLSTWCWWKTRHRAFLVTSKAKKPPRRGAKKMENLDYDLVLPPLTLVSQLDRVVWRRPSDHIEQKCQVDSFPVSDFVFAYIFIFNLYFNVMMTSPNQASSWSWIHSSKIFLRPANPI